MELLQRIEEIVRQAGEIILAAEDINNCTRQKTSAADLVTAYDEKVESFLKEKLMPLVPGSVFFGEEEKVRENAEKGWAYIVDPIDGTANFVRGFSQSAVSVALAKDGRVEYAVAYDPYRNEMFTAQRGKGAFMNGEPIHVSERPLQQGVFGMGSSPYNRSLKGRTFQIQQLLFEQSCDFRRMGAAVLDLCAVACGRLDAFYECELSPWDYATGSLLITEAGGYVSTLENERLPIIEKCSVWASNAVNKDIVKELKG